MQGKDGFVGVVFPDTECCEEHSADRQRADHLYRVPWIGDPGPGEPDQDGDHARNEEDDAQPIDSDPPVTGEPWHENRNHRQRDQPKRQIDQEDPAPAEVVGGEAAHQRPDDAAQPEDAHDQTHPAAAFAGRKDIAHGGDAQRHHGPAADSGNRPSRDQLAHVL